MKKKKHRDVITNRTDEDYDEYEKVVVPKSSQHTAAILKALQGHFLFGDLAPSSLRDLVDVMKPRTYSSGDVVIRQGDLGEEFFVLVSGVCEVLIEGVGKVHEYDGVGAFGELALMYSSPRAATIRSTAASQLFILDLRTFRMVLAQANENGLMAKVNFLRRVKLLKGLGDNQITRIAGALTEETFRKGAYVIKQGDIGDAFYIIKEGEVSDKVTACDSLILALYRCCAAMLSSFFCCCCCRGRRGCCCCSVTKTSVCCCPYFFRLSAQPIALKGVSKRN